MRNNSKSHTSCVDDPEAESCSKLPLPLPLPEVFGSVSEPASGAPNNLLGLSVFANPFEQAREQELSILEKHVKLKEQEKLDKSKDKFCLFKSKDRFCLFKSKDRLAEAADCCLAKLSKVCLLKSKETEVGMLE